MDCVNYVLKSNVMAYGPVFCSKEDRNKQYVSFYAKKVMDCVNYVLKSNVMGLFVLKRNKMCFFG